MQRTTFFLALFSCLALTAVAQGPAQAQPPDKPGTPVVEFVLDWSAQNPPRYSIAVDAIGRATYRCEPAPGNQGADAPDPYVVEWTITEGTRGKIFEAAEKLKYFQDAQFESKAKIAKTGVKTLTYKDSSRNFSASYNYSENPLVRDLTHLFQSIASTAEMGRKLEHDLRYDKLGVDADLKALQEQQKQGDAIEFGSVAPLLQKIAGNASMMRMSQQRAKEILHMAGISTEETTAGK
jgi:hypothetical protein